MIPVEIQDLCPSNTRFKIFIFAGNLLSEVLSQNLKTLAEGLRGRDGVLRGFDDDIFDIITVLQGKKEMVDYLKVPSILRSSWDKCVFSPFNATNSSSNISTSFRVLVDETDASEKLGGHAYDAYGIGEDGAVVVVRPDGYVGLAVALNDVANIGRYFGGILGEEF